MLKETPSTKSYLEELCRSWREIAKQAQLGKEFLRIVRSRNVTAWPHWLEAARHAAPRGFVHGILRDQNAVQTALSLPWSNGPVERQIHRLKLIKRQM